ncbi:MAG: hypothetical protein V4509_02655 [Patescibacteria group bacterium]
MFSKRTFAILAISLFTISLGGFAKAASIIPQGFLFQQNIKMGATLVPDVSYLQNFLNQNSITRVADTGPGSDGELTNYFGQKTLDAVMRFQNLYSSEILIPAGITVPTGFFGENTRKKINALLSSTNVITAIQNTKQITTPQSTAKKPALTSIFSEDSFDQGTTTEGRPIISGLYPNLVYSDADEIHIYGYRFTNIDNVIYGTLGSIENLSSVNNTITIRLKDFSQFDSASKYYSGTTTDIYIKVSNILGTSEEVAAVRYTFPNIGNYDSQFNASSTASSNKSSNSNMNSLGMTDIGSVDKEVQGFGPDGTLIKLIGGESTFDTLYGYTPSGVIFGGGPGGSGGGAGGGIGGIGGGAGGGAGGIGGGGAQVDNFGGQVTNITECTCSGGRLVTVKDIRGDTKDLFYGYGRSTLHEEYNLSTGVNVVGGFTQSSTACEVYDGEECDQQGTAQGDIDFPRGVGTSLSSGGGI